LKFDDLWLKMALLMTYKARIESRQRRVPLLVAKDVNAYLSEVKALAKSKKSTTILAGRLLSNFSETDE
jgi:hypothetical protein